VDKEKSPLKGIFLSIKYYFYCPLISEAEFAESETEAGALHAFAAVLNADHAAVRLVRHALEAVLTEALNADHAVFTPALT
jgi:hypothetical protein